VHTEQVSLLRQAAAHVRLAHPREEGHVADDADAEVEQRLERRYQSPGPQRARRISSAQEENQAASRRISLSTRGSRRRSARVRASVDFPEPGAPLIKIATGRTATVLSTKAPPRCQPLRLSAGPFSLDEDKGGEQARIGG
jgi:hypothetical protein